jgi:5-methylcytosine-specific restriction endonuclease McrA
MHSLRHFNVCSWSFFLECKKGTQNRTRENIELVESIVETAFNEYDSAFHNSIPHLLSPKNIQDPSNVSLNKLYRSAKPPIKRLRTNLANEKYNRLLRCPSCGINEASQLDHYLPKSIYFEFSVHPKNLIPICGDCNLSKGTELVRGGQRLYINPYLDYFIELRHLECIAVINNDNVISTSLGLIKPPDMLVGDFNVLSHHYEELDLLERLSKDLRLYTGTAIDEITNYLETGMDWQAISKIIELNTISNRRAYGQNHIESLVKESLIKIPGAPKFFESN